MPRGATLQEPPGAQHRMTPRPDCGEESYVGTGRLMGKSAIITGAAIQQDWMTNPCRLVRPGKNRRGLIGS